MRAMLQGVYYFYQLADCVGYDASVYYNLDYDFSVYPNLALLSPLSFLCR